MIDPDAMRLRWVEREDDARDSEYGDEGACDAYEPDALDDWDR